MLNQVYERDTDALMRRTRLRPLPDGRVPPADARIFGIVLAAPDSRCSRCGTNLARGGARAGDARHLPARLHADEAALAAGHARRRGARRAAAAHRLDGGARQRCRSAALALFAIVFLWQIPHFMAIAWLYRDDYGKAGFPMLPVVEPDGRRTGRQAVLYAAALLPVSLVPTLVGVSGPVVLLDRGSCSASVCSCAGDRDFARDRAAMRRRARCSSARSSYLPLIWVAMIAMNLTSEQRSRDASTIFRPSTRR